MCSKCCTPVLSSTVLVSLKSHQWTQTPATRSPQSTLWDSVAITVSSASGHNNLILIFNFLNYVIVLQLLNFLLKQEGSLLGFRQTPWFSLLAHCRTISHFTAPALYQNLTICEDKFCFSASIKIIGM